MPQLSLTQQPRIWEIDLLRALAILGMLYFHWFYLLDFWNLKNTDLFVDGWEVFGNIIRNTFFIVVGAGLVLSYQQSTSLLSFGLKTSKKGLILIFLGGLITLCSIFFTPDQVIWFGVLSFIGTSMVLLWPLLARWYWLALFTMMLLSLEFFLGEVWQSKSFMAYTLGFYSDYWPSVDYFPLVPWLASITGGATLASLIFVKGKRTYSFFSAPLALHPLLWVGQNALWIYLLHIPILIAIIHVGVIINKVIQRFI